MDALFQPIWLGVAWVLWILLIVFDKDNINNGVSCVLWPVTLLAGVGIGLWYLAVILPAEGLKWIIRRCKGG